MKRKEEEQQPQNNEARELWLDIGDTTKPEKETNDNKETTTDEEEDAT